MLIWKSQSNVHGKLSRLWLLFVAEIKGVDKLLAKSWSDKPDGKKFFTRLCSYLALLLLIRLKLVKYTNHMLGEGGNKIKIYARNNFISVYI